MRAKLQLCLALLLLLCASQVIGQTSWVKYHANPVFDLGDSATWDDRRLSPDHVILENNTYRMWYTGWDGTTNKNFRIGLATSLDGINWNREITNPILDLGDTLTFDSWNVAQPTVLKDAGIYKMWYTGGDGTRGKIGYATSTDGISWTKYELNPVLEPGGNGVWDSLTVHWCSVIKEDNMYKMWYSGGATYNSHRIGCATSPDGLSWEKYIGNPVLSPEHSGSWDDVQVWFPHVVKEGTTYHMWYGGNDGTRSRLGYASSQDGIHWDVHSVNPVLELGSPGEWDDESAGKACILMLGDDWKMWYQGFEGDGKARVGYAEKAPPIPVVAVWMLPLIVLLFLSIGVLIIIRHRARAFS